MSHESNEPAGLCGLRKQVTEAKEGPLELRRKSKKTHLWGKERGKDVSRERKRGKVWCAPEGESHTESFILRALSGGLRGGSQ